MSDPARFVREWNTAMIRRTGGLVICPTGRLDTHTRRQIDLARAAGRSVQYVTGRAERDVEMAAREAKPMPQPPDLTGAALACAARGWPVFPLRPADKRPLTGFTSWERHATTDPATIRAFWARGPFNVAVACGPAALVVIDLDTPKPGERPPTDWALPGVNDGADVFAVLCERHRRPFPFDTFTVTTRTGGMHLYFQAPPGAALRNTKGGTPRGLGWLIDTRAHGGYVVAPGSFVDLPDGTGPYQVIHDVPPAPLPDWLAGLLDPAADASPALGCPSPAAEGIGDLDDYTTAALQGESDRVAGAARGGRNHALNKAAYNLGRLVGAGVLADDLAFGRLYEVAMACHGHPPDPITAAEATATIRSGLAAGARNPRSVTPRRNAA